MIETQIKDIDPDQIELNIEEELEMTNFIELPEDTGEFQISGDEPEKQRQLYGLSYYLKQLNDPVYRRNALREFFYSREYRRTFYFLLRRALANKLRAFLKGFSS